LEVNVLDNRPIGVFDSGLGGLTAVRELSRLLPCEDIVYFGDTGRVPYGGRSRETILKYARQDIAFLRTFDLKAIVIACGTVSATTMETLVSENAIPLLGVVEPAGLAAVKATKNKKIGLIGTQASIRSGAYERVISGFDPCMKVTAAPCPLLVPLVENGRFRQGDAVAETVTAEYLAPIKKAGVDTLVLGCTHYPLLKPIIAACMGSGVTLIDAGEQCARQVVRLLNARDALASEGKTGAHHYYVSDTVEGFARLASIFLLHDVTEEVKQVDIDAF
jgi:glutamate racemase